MSLTLKRYFRDQAHLSEILLSLPLCSCPFCHMSGTLIRHGYLNDTYGENKHPTHTQGRRVICNARRKHRAGCGRSLSIVPATILKHFCITAVSLWIFLLGVLRTGSKAKAFRQIPCSMHISSSYRLWKRFSQAQSRLRSLLSRECPRPRLPETPCPQTQTVSHLQTTFSDHPCPIAAFQEKFQQSFL